MPSTSRRQHNLMEIVAHDPAAAKRLGIPQSVGKDFEAADKGKHFGAKHHGSHHRAKALMNLGHYAHPKKRTP